MSPQKIYMPKGLQSPKIVHKKAGEGALPLFFPGLVPWDKALSTLENPPWTQQTQILPKPLWHVFLLKVLSWGYTTSMPRDLIRDRKSQKFPINFSKIAIFPLTPLFLDLERRSICQIKGLGDATLTQKRPKRWVPLLDLQDRKFPFWPQGSQRPGEQKSRFRHEGQGCPGKTWCH